MQGNAGTRLKELANGRSVQRNTDGPQERRPSVTGRRTQEAAFHAETSAFLWGSAYLHAGGGISLRVNRSLGLDSGSGRKNLIYKAKGKKVHFGKKIRGNIDFRLFFFILLHPLNFL